MSQGFFELKTAQDLLGKLKREFTQLQRAPLNQDVAFNLFITAEHIADWLYPGYINKTKRESLRDSDVLLQVGSYIANGLKHFKAEAKHHKSVSGTSITQGAFDPNIFQNDAFDVGHLVIELDGDAAIKLGHSIDVVELARRILEFWENSYFLRDTSPIS